MRILLVKTSSLGDVVHNLPVATDIARRYPGATIDWVVEEAFAAIPRLHPAVRRVIPVAVRRWRKALLSPATWSGIATARRAIAEETYDAVLDTQGLLKSALLAAQARGPRLGHSARSAREPLAARFYDRGFDIPRHLHAVERNRRLAAAALGYAADDLPLDYGIGAPTPGDPDRPPSFAPWLPAGDYAVLLTATSRADKEWPEEDWIALGQALIVMGMRCVLPAGSPAERERAARLAATLGRAVAAPPLDIAALASLMAGAQVVVGVDTGLTHLAAALDRPTVALFCGSEPRLTGVYAGARAVNLGGPGRAPGAGEVLAACAGLLNA
jgi:heptosyltransferase-1